MITMVMMMAVGNDQVAVVGTGMGFGIVGIGMGIGIVGNVLGLVQVLLVLVLVLVPVAVVLVDADDGAACMLSVFCVCVWCLFDVALLFLFCWCRCFYVVFFFLSRRVYSCFGAWVCFLLSLLVLLYFVGDCLCCCSFRLDGSVS